MPQITPAPPMADAGPTVPSLRTLGSGANQAAAGNDSRFATLSNVGTTPAANRIPQATSGAVIDNTWLDTTIIAVDHTSALKQVPTANCRQRHKYRTLGYASAYDGGGAEYEWRPSSTATSDDAFVFKPNDIGGGAGRWHYVNSNGVFDAAATELSNPAPLTSYGERIMYLMKTAPTYGFSEVVLPAKNIDVRDLTGDTTQVRYQGIARIKLSGRGAGKTNLTTTTTYTSLHPQHVRLATTAALPSCIAAGTGASKTLTATANGALSIDSTAVINGDFVLIANQVNPVDNGPYVVTQAGSGGAPFILTRANWMNSSNSLKVRIGIYVEAGVSNIYGIFTLSNVASGWYSSAAMTMDVSAQYWDLEPFVATHFLIQSGGEFQLAAGASYLMPTGWTQWMAPGEKKWINVQGLAGGSATDPATGHSVTYTALQPGDVVYAAFGADPTDQATPNWFRRVSVESIDASGNVYVDTSVPSYSVDVTSLGGGPPYPTNGNSTDLGVIDSVGVDTLTLATPANAGLVSVGDYLSFGLTSVEGGQYAPVASSNAGTGVITFNTGTLPQYTITPSTTHAWLSKCFPQYNVNFNLLATTNKYFKVVRECRDIEICHLTFDGVGPNMSFVENLSIHDIEIKNLHATFFGICQSMRVKNLRMKNINGYSFPGVGGGGWYGWAIQNNLNYDGYYDGVFVDGLSADFIDQEGGNETRWANIEVILQKAPVFHPQSIVGTTPYCIRQNPVINLTVRGTNENAIPLISQPVTNLTWESVSGTNGTMGWGGTSLEYFTGKLIYKGREYALDQSKRFITTIQLSGAATRIVRVPYQGLWFHSRVYAKTLQGITNFYVYNTGSLSAFDALGGVKTYYRFGKWFDPGLDSQLPTYPNGGDVDLKYLSITTDGSTPAGSCLIFETHVAPEINRGNGFSGVSTFVDSRRMIPFVDNSTLEELYGTGAPGSTPDFAGQRYIDTAAGAIYCAVDVIGSGDWKKITP